MPRYPLILKDDTYITLYQEAARQGISLGKYINSLLNNAAEDLIKNVNEVKPELTLCNVCNRKAKYRAWKNDINFYRCRLHKPTLKVCDGYKDIEER